MGIRLTFNTGFDQSLRKRRLASLLEIGQLFKGNSHELSLQANNLENLASSSREIRDFYNTDNETSKNIDNLTTQVDNSCQVLKKKAGEGKIHKASVRSLTNSIQKLSPLVDKIIEKELEKEQNSTMKLKLNSNKSS